MAKTERARYIFSVKEAVNGDYFIALEPFDGNIELLKNGFLAFDLPKGINEEKAYQIAKYMDENIKSLAYTSIS
jgi:hypothetical protein